MVDEQKLRQLAEAATPGPWSAFVVGNTVSVDIGDKPTGASKCIVHWMGFDSCDLPKKAWKANARLIAAANPAAILSLLDELQTLREERTAWRVSAENAMKELEAIKYSLGSPVAWQKKRLLRPDDNWTRVAFENLQPYRDSSDFAVRPLYAMKDKS